jgi:glyoxylase-like metal-dependent hydrolase (beta-lactamase superfamily II)/8-oxo-dGTP pyrophosphatase MutT (NUDIX family)
VVLVRTGDRGLEVLLTQRPSTMAFAPDVHVFPGGAVDEADGDASLASRSSLTPGEAEKRLGWDLTPADALAVHVAALRELFEEAGILLATARALAPEPTGLERDRAALLDGSVPFGELVERLDLELRLDRLVPLSRWVTPRFVPRRFDTRFFAAELPEGLEPSFAESEVVAHRWMSPGDALAACAAGEIDLWLPTSTTLQQLEHASSFEEIADSLGPGLADPVALMEEGRGLLRVVLPGAGGVAGQSVNAYVVGVRDLVVVDPGDPSEAALDTFLALTYGESGRAIRGVVITHGDPDHHAGAEALARTLEVPIFGDTLAARSLPYAVTDLGDGQVVPVGDVELRALSTPGHRADHMSLVAPGERFVVAGDVVGSEAGRSIPGPADVALWSASLERLGSLGSVRLFPGHGDPFTDSAAAIQEARGRLAPQS